MSEHHDTDATDLERRRVLQLAGATLMGGLAAPASTTAASQGPRPTSTGAAHGRPLGVRLQGVQHCGLTVQNMDRAFAFYTEVLGGTEVMRDGDFHGERIHNTLLTDQGQVEHEGREEHLERKERTMAITNEAVRAFRRIVTGHDQDGRAVIMSDAAPTRVQQVGGPGGPTFFEVWNTRETPVTIDRQSGEPAEGGLVLAPPEGGTRLRVIDFPPEGEAIRRLTAAEAAEKFGEMGDAKAAQSRAGAPHPLMHRTETLDYGLVLEGELTLVVDQGETTIRAGDIVIQRGTSHAWANRSAENCRVAFVLIDGRFVDGL